VIYYQKERAQKGEHDHLTVELTSTTHHTGCCSREFGCICDCTEPYVMADGEILSCMQMDICCCECPCGRDDEQE
jgi:hypothetical protein